MTKGKAPRTNERITKEVDMSAVLTSKRKRKPSQLALDSKTSEDLVRRRSTKKTGKTPKSTEIPLISFTNFV